MENAFGQYWWLFLAAAAVIVGLVQAIKVADKASKLSGWYTVIDVLLCGVTGVIMALPGLLPWEGIPLAVMVLGFLSTIGYQTFVKPWIEKGIKAVP
jgi:hypothetical protein